MRPRREVPDIRREKTASNRRFESAEESASNQRFEPTDKI
jgi:hypothetical protein